MIKTLSWSAAAIVEIVVIAMPPILMLSNSDAGRNRLEAIGKVGGAAVVGLGVAFVIPAVGFLLGLGWAGAKQFLH